MGTEVCEPVYCGFDPYQHHFKGRPPENDKLLPKNDVPNFLTARQLTLLGHRKKPIPFQHVQQFQTMNSNCSTQAATPRAQKPAMKPPVDANEHLWKGQSKENH